MKKACWRWVNSSAKKSVEAGSVRDIDKHLFFASTYACDFSLVKRAHTSENRPPKKGSANFSLFTVFQFRTERYGNVCSEKNSWSSIAFPSGKHFWRNFEFQFESLLRLQLERWSPEEKASLKIHTFLQQNLLKLRVSFRKAKVYAQFLILFMQ